MFSHQAGQVKRRGVRVLVGEYNLFGSGIGTKPAHIGYRHVAGGGQVVRRRTFNDQKVRSGGGFIQLRAGSCVPGKNGGVAGVDRFGDPPDWARRIIVSVGYWTWATGEVYSPLLHRPLIVEVSWL